VEEAISEIRQQAGQVEMIFYAYVLDEYEHLLGDRFIPRTAVR
jgi:Mg/Co/Ni transporter MgtE